MKLEHFTLNKAGIGYLNACRSITDKTDKQILASLIEAELNTVKAEIASDAKPK